MMIFRVLRHQLLRRFRSAVRGRNLFETLFLLLAVAYFGVVFAALAWFFPEIVSEVDSGLDPLRLLNEFLLHTFGILLVWRFFLQRSAGSDALAYLQLPIRRSRLVRLLQVLSALSVFNLLPAVLLALLWGSTVVPSASVTGATFWIVGVILALASTQFANSLLRAAWDRSAFLVLAGIGGLTGLVVAGNLVGVRGLRAGSLWLFDGLSAGQVGPLLVLIVAAFGTAVGAHRALRTRIYELVGASEEVDRTVSGRMLSDRGRGPVTSLALLDAKLILRNKRPRQMLLTGVLLIGILILTFEPETPADAVFRILFGFLLSGQLGLMHTQFGVAWHGTHFDGLLARAIAPTTVVRAQFVIFAGLCIGSLAVVLPIAAWFEVPLLLPLLAFLPYHLGVTAPTLLGLGVWSREAIQLTESTFFNSQGTSYIHFLAVLPILFLPIGLVLLFDASTVLLVAAGLGILGLAMAPLWTRGIGKALRWQRHAMAAGFREE